MHGRTKAAVLQAFREGYDPAAIASMYPKTITNVKDVEDLLWESVPRLTLEFRIARQRKRLRARQTR